MSYRDLRSKNLIFSKTYLSSDNWQLYLSHYFWIRKLCRLYVVFILVRAVQNGRTIEIPWANILIIVISICTSTDFKYSLTASVVWLLVDCCNHIIFGNFRFYRDDEGPWLHQAHLYGKLPHS